MKKIIATIVLFSLIIMNVFNYAFVSAVSITEDTELSVEQEKVSDTKETTVQELLKEESPKTEPVKETPTQSVAEKVIPKTGESDLLYIALSMAVIVAIISGVGMLRYKNK